MPVRSDRCRFDRSPQPLQQINQMQLAIAIPA